MAQNSSSSAMAWRRGACWKTFRNRPGLYDVTIFNAEPRANYDRIMLSPVLSGEKSYEDIVIHNDEWYAANNVTLHKGAKVTGIDRDNKTVTSENGITVSYDRLVIATGSLPFIIPSTAINCRAFSPIAISTMSRRCLKSPKARVAPSSSAPAFWVWKQLMG